MLLIYWVDFLFVLFYYILILFLFLFLFLFYFRNAIVVKSKIIKQENQLWLFYFTLTIKLRYTLFWYSAIYIVRTSDSTCRITITEDTTGSISIHRSYTHTGTPRVIWSTSSPTPQPIICKYSRGYPIEGEVTQDVIQSQLPLSDLAQPDCVPIFQRTKGKKMSAPFSLYIGRKPLRLSSRNGRLFRRLSTKFGNTRKRGTYENQDLLHFSHVTFPCSHSWLHKFLCHSNYNSDFVSISVSYCVLDVFV